MIYVLVPGAWTGAWVWDEVVSRRSDKGHTMYSITVSGLTSDEDAASVSLDTHVRDVVSYLESGGASVDDYIATRASEQQYVDCRRMMVLLKKVTGESPKMWGPSIVGYGSYRYVYESGRSGEAPLVGFAIRGRELVIYVDIEGDEQQLLLSKLGKHRMGKVCLYFKRLSELDSSVLEKLVANSVAAVTRRYG